MRIEALKVDREALLAQALAGAFPDERGRFGPFGGRRVPETLVPAHDRLQEGVRSILPDPAFRAELESELRTWVGRPTPLTLARELSGGDFSHVTGDEINIEFFPNRPDLTSVEGIARASRAFFEFKTGLQTYESATSNIRLTVDSSVKKIRPFVTTALVKNVTMTDELITSLMGLQEKLHVGLGRNRKKVAIGIHNAEAVTPPFIYKAVDPDAVSFVPLAKNEEMTLREILKKHEKGVDYAHLLKGFDKYPLIIDGLNNVLFIPTDY